MGHLSAVLLWSYGVGVFVADALPRRYFVSFVYSCTNIGDVECFLCLGALEPCTRTRAQGSSDSKHRTDRTCWTGFRFSLPINAARAAAVATFAAVFFTAAADVAFAPVAADATAGT